MRSLPLMLAALLLLLAGCPGQKPAPQQYSVISLAIDSQEHILSNEYNIYAEVGNDSIAANKSLVLSISDNGKKFSEIRLGGENASVNTSFAIPWIAEKVGNHTINATIEDENGAVVSPPRALNLFVSQIGTPANELIAGNVPLDAQVWCAQKFRLSNSVALSEAKVGLISLIPTGNNLVILEIRNDSGGIPSRDAIVESANISSREVRANYEWHAFPLEGKQYSAGDYWIVLMRSGTVGNLAWEHSQAGNGAVCISQSGAWAGRTGDFFFQIR